MSQTKYVVETTYNLVTAVCCDKMFHGELPPSKEITPIDGQYTEEVVHRYCIHCGTKADYDVVRTPVATITQTTGAIFSETTSLEEEKLVSQLEYVRCDFALLASHVDVSAAEKQEIEHIDRGSPLAYFDGTDCETLKRPTLVVVSHQHFVARVYRWKYADTQEVESAILDIIRCLKY